MSQENQLPQLKMVLDDMDQLPPVPELAGYRIRSFCPGDEAGWDVLRRETFPEIDVRFNPFITTDPSFDPKRVIFAVDGENNPVASACGFEREEQGQLEGYIHMVMALSAHKGRSLGYAVTLAALHALKERGSHQAWLTTDDHRLAAVQVYRRLGFVIVDNHPSIAGRWQAVCRVLDGKADKPQGCLARSW